MDKLLLGDSEELPKPALMRDLKVSLEELLDKRRIRESGAWRNRWMQEGVDALNVADIYAAIA